MIERRINQDFKSQPSLYLEHLLNQIKTRYAQNISDWINCSSSDESRFLACSTLWIAEDAKLDCELVYRDENNQRITPATGFDLSGTYFTKAIDIVEQRLIQGGVRLAAVINKIVQSTSDNNKPNNICYGTMGFVMVLLMQSILLLALLSYTCLRRRTTIIESPETKDKKEYIVIA